jgi:hypothetical protein
MSINVSSIQCQLQERAKFLADHFSALADATERLQCKLADQRAADENFEINEQYQATQAVTVARDWLTLVTIRYNAEREQVRILETLLMSATGGA